MAVIFVAHGLTGAGKTEVANYLQEKYKVTHFHPIRFTKAHYERLLQKPEGFLETKEGKQFAIPGNSEHTMQEFMVELYHFMRLWMPNYSTMNMAVELPKLLAHGNVCCVSLRNPQEIDQLLAIRDEGFHDLVLLSLHRQDARRETSDEYYQHIRERLTQRCNQLFPINNNFSLEHLQSTLDRIMKFCKYNHHGKPLL